MTRRCEWVAPQWRERLQSAGLPSVSALLLRSPTELALAGHWQALTKPGLGGRQRWRWELPDTGGERTVLFVKRYQRATPGSQWDRLRRHHPHHSRAWWELNQCRRLADANISAPQAVGAAEIMYGPCEGRSVVIFQAVAGDGFDRVWTKACEQNAPVTRGLARHDVAARLARFVSAFHQSGACHRDLYLCHVFVDLDPEGGRPPTFTVIDLARVIRPWLRRMRWIIKDLAQLDCSARQIGASRTDRLRFLHTYLGLERGAPRVRWYARRVHRKSQRILRRIERKSGQA